MKKLVTIILTVVFAFCVTVCASATPLINIDVPNYVSNKVEYVVHPDLDELGISASDVSIEQEENDKIKLTITLSAAHDSKAEEWRKENGTLTVLVNVFNSDRTFSINSPVEVTDEPIEIYIDYSGNISENLMLVVYPDNNSPIFAGSTLSEGNLTIICTVAAAVVFGLGGFFLGKATKKKSALASDTETGDEE